MTPQDRSLSSLLTQQNFEPMSASTGITHGSKCNAPRNLHLMTRPNVKKSEIYRFLSSSSCSNQKLSLRLALGLCSRRSRLWASW